MTLVGVLHKPTSSPAQGVIIVVGGPQYRVGSHRQFVHLARHLAARGIAVLRFDCCGMGDSDGEFPGFERIEPDIASAVDAMVHHLPSVAEIALWGLCDATLAISTYAHRDPRVVGVALANPWVRTEASQARTQLKHYYVRRLKEPDFFRKILRGEFHPFSSALELLGNVRRAGHLWPRRRALDASTSISPLAERMAEGLTHFTGKLLFIVSGQDLTAREFEDACGDSDLWRKILAGERVTYQRLESADHTFSQRAWCDEVARRTEAWVRSLTIKQG